MRATLCALVLALAAWPLAAHADDYGPQSDIATLRHDLPILVTGREVDRVLTMPITVDGVVVQNDAALAQWHAGTCIAIDSFQRTHGRWQLVTEASGGVPASYTTADSGYESSVGPTKIFLSHVFTSDEDLLDLAVAHLPAAAKAQVRASSSYDVNSGVIYRYGSYSTGAVMTSSDPFFGPQPLRAGPLGGGGFRLYIQFGANDGWSGEGWPVFGDAPSFSTGKIHGSTVYYVASGAVFADRPVHVQPGTTIDVWFPYVLDPSQRYRLVLSGAARRGRSIVVDGSLTNNVLHFTLPAFTAPSNRNMSFEIDGNAHS